MEILLHTMYVVAIRDSWGSKPDGRGGFIQIMAWEDDTPFELAMISIWNLVIVWLKVCQACF
jgi:hypothetical protein